MRASEKKIATALKAALGNVSLAARNIGVSRQHLHERIAESANLREVLHDARESMVDNAESALGRAVLQGEAWAVCFTLKTQGKGRGYIERQEIRQETKLAVTMSAEEMTDDELAAIAAGSGPRVIAPQTGENQPN